jgi:hypothetical protein
MNTRTYGSRDFAAVLAAVESEAVARAFARAGIDRSSLESDGIAAFGQWQLERFLPDRDTWRAVAHQYRGGTAYAFVVRGRMDANPDSLPGPVFGALSSFTFGDEAGNVFVPATFRELEMYIDSVVETTGGSVSVAAIRDGEVVYRYASGEALPGVRADVGDSYHWGSITKIATAVAYAQREIFDPIGMDSTAHRSADLPVSVDEVSPVIRRDSGTPFPRTVVHRTVASSAAAPSAK